jgi:apolipoprotein N-acyltransferase
MLLTVIQPGISWSALAWVSLVPFILACSPEAKPKVLIPAAYIVSFFYWLGNLYWICPVTWIGWVALCLYMAILWPIAAMCLRYCRIKNVSLFLAVPVLVVGAERLQGVFWGGFFWRFLAHSQYDKIALIQIADIFGAAGVSFLVAMVNGLAAELIISASQKQFFKISNLLKTAFVAGAVIAAIIYGRWRINQSGGFIEAGPIVGSVQTNVPQSVKESGSAGDEIFAELIGESDKAVSAGAKLVVFPETMVMATLDRRMLGVLNNSYHCKTVDKTLREYTKKNNVYLLVGAYGAAPLIREDFTIDFAQRYNSAFLYQADGNQSPEQYNKIHLLPFGEVVPFKKSAPWLYNLLMKLTPYDFDYSLDYGSKYTVFEMAGSRGEKERNYRFGVMICYEDSVPEIARKFTLDKQGKKNVDWLINISNDGWFVKIKDKTITATTELPQHTAVCVFRAVENRVAVLRSVNTGISCLIDTLGRIRDGFSAGTLPQRAMERKAIAGWFVDRVPVDRRITFFGRYGSGLDFCCAGGLVLALILQVLGLFGRKKK